MPHPSLHRFRLGNRRRQLLWEAESGCCIVSAADTHSEKRSRQRAATALLRAGLVAASRIKDFDAAGRFSELMTLSLTDFGREVLLVWTTQLRDGGAIRWSLHERRVAASASGSDRILPDQSIGIGQRLRENSLRS